MASGEKVDTSQGKKKPSGKRAKNLSQKEQSERFMETARILNSDETGESFEKAIERVVPARKSED